MDLSAYERRILNAIPSEQRTEILARYAVAVARQLRAAVRTRHTHETVVGQILDTLDVVRFQEPTVLVREIKDSRRMVCINLPDQPFIVDSVRMHLKGLGANTVTGFNVIVGLKRNEAGQVIAVDEPNFQLESILRFELEGGFDTSVEEMQQSLINCLELSKAVVSDFTEMTDTLERASERFEAAARSILEKRDEMLEASEFVDWLLQENFVFMGLQIGEQRSGILREGLEHLWSPTILDWNPDVTGTPVVVRKGNVESPIHRVGLVDELYLAVPNRDGQGFTAIHIIGLFTYRAVTQTSRHVPVLRRVLADILRTENPPKGSFRYKGICNVFDSLPTEFLFTLGTSRQLIELIERVLEAEQESDMRIDIAEQERQDTAFVLMAMPRVFWSDDRLDDVAAVLKKHTNASYVDHGAFVGRYNTILIHFFLTGTTELTKEGKEALIQTVTEHIRPWRSQLSDQLAGKYDEDNVERLLAQYGSAFDATYQRLRPINETLMDVEQLELLKESQKPIVKLLVVEDKERAYLRVYQQRNLLLSDMLPIIDNFGLQVVDQFADPVLLSSGEKYTIDTFRLAPSADFTMDDIRQHSSAISAGLEAAFEGKVSTGVLNWLVLRAGLDWEAVDMFRAIFGYARQLGLSQSSSRLQNILLSNVPLVKALWRFFEAKFNPHLEGDRTAQIAAASDECETLIRALTDQVRDLVFRTVFNLMDSILRTNFYRSDRKFHYISFKIDCAKVHNMPAPRMMVEVYVHHVEMEGIHLRGGKIARGGIRWSDRSDFRREVLDLVATQMVKNVLIVPEGAKGGFRMKHQVADWAERRRKADELYKVLIRGLLDITDNQVDGEIVHPPEVVRHDEVDPYLVVAADKGTAHLSDTANGLSAEYGFWLGDAFASGGSNGYDHKAVGITARGGWATVLRHFEEMGLNPETEDYTAVAIGDPAGDVFGNGVVYLKQKTQCTNHMKLLGAFNHKHIFLDPNPNPQVAYEERVRLFENVQGWEHYNTDLISQGGGVFSRSAKSIPISTEVQQMLGLLKDQTELPPEVVIRILLRLDVDLLWNGGIGTYVKSTEETHMDAGDPSNDNLRVNGSELRARIVGEGGNLGFTQNGRIEYALNGGRLNTDAIDNSGGVDMSDHEVNLKILLNPLVASGALALDDRNTLLESMTEEVAQDVLGNNDCHARQLSLDKLRSEADPMAFAIAIQWVCTRSNASRTFLRLPSDDELAKRQALGKGLTRPELAVIAAHIKMHVFKDLLEADPALIEDFDQRVLGYFPDKIQAKYAEEVANHMLKPSIGMTVLLNEIMGDAGALLFPMLNDITDASSIDIVRAWLAAMEAIDAKSLREQMTELDLQAQYAAWTAITKPLNSMLGTWLFSGTFPDADHQAKLQAVLEAMPGLVGSKDKERMQRHVDELMSKDVPESLALRIVALDDVALADQIARTMSDVSEVNDKVISYLAIGEASLFVQTIRTLEDRRAIGGWDPAANAILRSRFLHQLNYLVDMVDLGDETTLGTDRVAFRLRMYHFAGIYAELKTIIVDGVDLAGLVVANARAQAIIRGMSSAGTKLLGSGYKEQG